MCIVWSLSDAIESSASVNSEKSRALSVRVILPIEIGEIWMCVSERKTDEVK